MKKYVMFIDIVSSSKIMEDLIQNSNDDNYSKLIDLLCLEIEGASERYGIEIYKFLGDGFILLFNDDIKADDIVEFAIYFIDNCNRMLDEFLFEYVESEIEKTGITIGLSYGKITSILVLEKNEYFGRPINLASRLQSRNEIPNTILMQKDIYLKLNTYMFKKSCKETSMSFHNINNDNRIRCYRLFCNVLINHMNEKRLSTLDVMKLRGTEKEKYFKDVIDVIEKKIDDIKS